MPFLPFGPCILRVSAALLFVLTRAVSKTERAYDVRTGQGDSQDGDRCTASAERDRDSGQHVLRDGA